jgi:hypothetical protein
MGRATPFGETISRVFRSDRCRRSCEDRRPACRASLGFPLPTVSTSAAHCRTIERSTNDHRGMICKRIRRGECGSIKLQLRLRLTQRGGRVAWGGSPGLQNGTSPARGTERWGWQVMLVAHIAHYIYALVPCKPLAYDWWGPHSDSECVASTEICGRVGAGHTDCPKSAAAA